MDRDVADALQVMTLEMRAGFAEMRAGFAEMRAGLAESRADTAVLRADVAEFRSAVTARLDTLFAALAEFRAEYQEHTHGGEAA